eukprot:8463895-Pyramimonas_sp.AAC.1
MVAPAILRCRHSRPNKKHRRVVYAPHVVQKYKTASLALPFMSDLVTTEWAKVWPVSKLKTYFHVLLGLGQPSK